MKLFIQCSLACVQPLRCVGFQESKDRADNHSPGSCHPMWKANKEKGKACWATSKPAAATATVNCLPADESMASWGKNVFHKFTEGWQFTVTGSEQLQSNLQAHRQGDKSIPG